VARLTPIGQIKGSGGLRTRNLAAARSAALRVASRYFYKMYPFTGRLPNPLLESFTTRFDSSVTIPQVLSNNQLTLEHIAAVFEALIHTFDDETLPRVALPGVRRLPPDELEAILYSLKAVEGRLFAGGYLYKGPAERIRYVWDELARAHVPQEKRKPGRPAALGTWLMQELNEAMVGLDVSERAKLIAGLVTEFAVPIEPQTTGTG